MDTRTYVTPATKQQADRYGIPATTKIGMPASDRRPSLPREYLIRYARAGSRIAADAGAPRLAAICDAYLQLLVENDRLRDRLATAQGWDDMQTKQQERPQQAKLVAHCAERTDTINVQGGRR